jgi:hypothetical protein
MSSIYKRTSQQFEPWLVDLSGIYIPEVHLEQQQQLCCCLSKGAGICQRVVSDLATNTVCTLMTDIRVTWVVFFSVLSKHHRSSYLIQFIIVQRNSRPPVSEQLKHFASESRTYPRDSRSADTFQKQTTLRKPG